MIMPMFDHPYLKSSARLADLTGNLDDRLLAEIRQKSDSQAINEDWERVGEALWKAIRSYERKAQAN